MLKKNSVVTVRGPRSVTGDLHSRTTGRVWGGVGRWCGRVRVDEREGVGEVAGKERMGVGWE